MVETLIIKNERYRILRIPLKKYSDEWIVFRVKTIRKNGEPIRQSRLSYSRFQNRFARGHSFKAFADKNLEGLYEIRDLIQKAIRDGLV